MFAKPQAEHAWFTPLLGQWEFTHECDMGPDQPTSKSSGTVSVRTFGGLWFLAESCGNIPDGDPWTSLMTLGFDPVKNQYCGTFIGSMMTHLWLYAGHLDASQKQLTLEVEGPKFDGTGMTMYQDIIEIVSNDEWTLRSKILGDDGQWNEFMIGRHQRVA